MADKFPYALFYFHLHGKWQEQIRKIGNFSDWEIELTALSG
jgi:hypothetical protein